jgi:glycerophosphoryl diester phosphodiesterase
VSGAATSVARLFPAFGRRQRGRWLTRGARPRIWAHRGASAHTTENTVAAFALARDHGADGVELDVRLCASGEVVVFHDEDLQRLAGRPERIDARSWRELSAIELAGGHRIPRLEEALEACGDLPVNVELKSLTPGRPGRLPGLAARAIRAAGADERVVVSSFDPAALWLLHAAAPHLPLAYLFEARLARALRSSAAAALVGASAVHPEHVLCTPAQVAAWRARRLAVNAWAVDDPARLRALAAAGVDGIFANDPLAARAVLDPAPEPPASP